MTRPPASPDEHDPRRFRRQAIGLVATMVLLAACGGSGDGLSTLLDESTTTLGSSTTTAPTTTTTAPTTTAPTTTTSVAAATTIAETTTTVIETTTTIAETTTSVAEATTTTVAPVADGLVLRPDGLGPFDFGEVEADAILPVLVAALGPPDRDEVELYPILDGAGYATTDGDLAFTYPVGRTVCFTMGLCVELGGAMAPTVFVGWVQGPPIAGAALSTADGISVGSRWADHLGVMDVSSGGCYSAGWGTTAGGLIELLVISDGTWFGEFTADGGYIESLPDPSEVRVDSLLAGDRVVFVFADC